MTIDLNLSSDQRQIVSAARKLLQGEFSVARLRGPHSTSPDAHRVGLIAEMGGLGLGSPEVIGGAGFTLVEEMLFFTEMGRHLVTPNVFAAAIVARALHAAGSGDAATRVVAGTEGVSIVSALRPFDLAHLDGLPVLVVDAEHSAYGLLFNDSGVVVLDLRQLALESTAAADRSVALFKSTLSEKAVAARFASTSARFARQAQLLNAAQLLGMAEATRDMAVEYAKVRTQFGQPIGSFQAVKHRCADMAVRAKVLGAQLMFAALAERDGWPDATPLIESCRVLAGRYALDNARANIQIHGGIGFTAECDAHLYLLRAHLHDGFGAAVAAADRGVDDRVGRQNYEGIA